MRPLVHRNDLAAVDIPVDGALGEQAINLTIYTRFILNYYYQYNHHSSE